MENQELWVWWREPPPQKDHEGAQNLLRIVDSYLEQREDERAIGKLHIGLLNYGFPQNLAQTLAFTYHRQGEPVLAEAAMFGGDYRGEDLIALMPPAHRLVPKRFSTGRYAANIEFASSYFKDRAENTSPYVAVLFDYLGRRFGLSWRGPIVEGYLARSRTDYYLENLMRIVSPQAVAPFEFEADAMAQILFPALYCEQRPLPPFFYARLFWNSVRGGYNLTHAALALEWVREMGCIGGEREWTALREEQIRRMLAETERGDGDDDLFFERLAFLFYVGAGEWVKPEWIERVAKAQRKDGGWGPALGEDSNDHASFLAFWVLLEAENPDVPRTPMIR